MGAPNVPGTLFVLYLDSCTFKYGIPQMCSNTLKSKEFGLEVRWNTRGERLKDGQFWRVET